MFRSLANGSFAPDRQERSTPARLPAEARWPRGTSNSGWLVPRNLHGDGEYSFDGLRDPGVYEVNVYLHGQTATKQVDLQLDSDGSATPVEANFTIDPS